MTEYVTKIDINTALTLKGISYVLYTTSGEHVRQTQPCYGELRKYERTHKGECTQPHNPKPGDLHHPFPEGTPTALVVPFPNYTKSAETDAVFQMMFSADSPWYAGFKDVTFFKDASGFIAGIVINDMDIDPTVTVNCFKTMQGILQPNVAKDFVNLLDAGSTPNEALAIMMLNGGYGIAMGVQQPNAYKAPVEFSAKKFFLKTPNDLSGGVLRDRIDYNRTDMHKPFWGSVSEGGINWKLAAEEGGLPKFAGIRSTGGTPADTVKLFAEKGREVFLRAIDKEKDPEIKPFIWKTTSGKTNGQDVSAA